jgi:hypothetical protein
LSTLEDLRPFLPQHDENKKNRIRSAGACLGKIGMLLDITRYQR